MAVVITKYSLIKQRRGLAFASSELSVVLNFFGLNNDNQTI